MMHNFMCCFVFLSINADIDTIVKNVLTMTNKLDIVKYLRDRIKEI